MNIMWKNKAGKEKQRNRSFLWKQWCLGRVLHEGRVADYVSLWEERVPDLGIARTKTALMGECVQGQ